MKHRLSGVTATDLFAGAGGSSSGLQQAGISVTTAVNHWPIAIETHALNHPDTLHDIANISQTDPARYPRTNLLWASPSCTHHSRAQGKRLPRATGPTLFDQHAKQLPQLTELEPDRARATMFDVVRFTEHHAYDAVIVENVPAVLDWQLFDGWLALMRTLGYHYQPVILDAHHATAHGPAVAQSRPRWYGIFIRDDHQPAQLPTWRASTLGAIDILDPDAGRLLRDRPRPLAKRSMERVEATLDRYPDAQRMIVSYYGASAVGKPASEPIGTLTTRDRHAVITRTPQGIAYRMLNTAEQARAMGFGDHYRWAGTQADITKQIGNAVVPAAARDIGVTVVESLGVSA